MATRKRGSRKSTAVLSAAALIAVFAAAAFAQSSNGSVRGIVRDQTDAVIPGATLLLVNKATNVTASTTTNGAGFYVFPQVVPGKYSLTVTSPGMETLRASVAVEVQVSTNFDAMLKPGSTETVITVASEVTPLVISDSPALGHVLERQRIEQLPLNGRNIENLLVTVPGLQAPKPGNSVQVRSWGMAAGAHDYLLDGASLTDAMWNEGTIQRPPGLDTIQEFKVENNSSSAKYPRMTTIVMSSKGGSNELHGSVFETNRNNAYGKARARQDIGSDFPTLSRNEFGGSLGGPVVIPGLYNGKNRTFFFSSYEGARMEAPGSLSSKVPTQAMRDGDFSGLLDSQGRLSTIYDPSTTDANWKRQPFNYGGQVNHIDSARISPLAQWVFKTIPLPTYPDRNPLLTNNWFGPTPDNTNQWTITERIDQRISDKDQFFGRYTQGKLSRFLDPYAWAGVVPSTDGVANVADYNHRNRSLALNYVRGFSPTLVNELSVTYSYTWSLQLTGEPGKDYNAELGLPNPFHVAGIPYIQSIGFGPTRYIRPASTNEQDYRYYIIQDNATKIVGKHELQFGANLRFDKLKTLPQQMLTTGTINFSNPATALYNPSSAPSSPKASPFTGSNIANLYLGLANYNAGLRKGVFDLRRNEYAFYFQDNYKLTPRLTLNLGVRWQLSPFISETSGITIPGFDPASRSILLSQPVETMINKGVTTQTIISALQDIGVKFKTYKEAGMPSKGAYDNWRDIGPHLGAAYRLGNGPRSMVIRGGLSKSFYNEGIWTWMDQAAANDPFIGDFSNNALTWASQSPDGLPNWGLRSSPSIIAGKNSQNAVSATDLPPYTPGQTSTHYFDPHQPSNYVWDWNFTIEKEVLPNTVARIGYVGNHAGNQMQAYYYNDQPNEVAYYETTGLPLPSGNAALVGNRPFDNTTYGLLGALKKSGFSNFNGVQLQMERQYTRGIAFQLSYVVGNAMRAGGMEGGGGYASPVYAASNFKPGLPTDYNTLNRLENYARDASVPKHLLRWNFIVDLPFGHGKSIGGNARGVLNGLIGGWQVAALGSLNSTYLQLSTSNWNLTGTPLEVYGYKYPIQDCTSGTCLPGYLYWNGYIPSNQINSHDADGNPNGIMGVPADYKAAVQPLIPWGSTAIPANFPAGANIEDYWGTNTAWVKLKDGSVVEESLSNDLGGNQPTLHPWRNQFINGPLQWNQDASLFKQFSIGERAHVRFTFDAFNVFNHPNNYGNNGSQDFITSGGILNTSEQANSARQLQLAVRLAW